MWLESNEYILYYCEIRGMNSFRSEYKDQIGEDLLSKIDFSIILHLQIQNQQIALYHFILLEK